MAEKMKMTSVDMATWALIIIGGLNWGLVGALNLNVVKLVLGSVPVVEQIVYILVGLSSLYAVYKMTTM